MPKLEDLTGRRFGRLVVISRSQNIGKQTVWKCKCDCGNMTHVIASKLKNGNTTSCGCYRSERVSSINFKHGKGTSKNSTYNTWTHLKDRCLNERNKQYKDYGGRGIKVFPKWITDFESFYNYVSKMPHFNESGRTLDRINNDGNYEPGNLRWATRVEQNNNRRCCKNNV